MKSEYSLIVSVSTVVLLTLIYGFTVSGSPFGSREKKLDSARVNNLYNLSSSIESYYSTNKKLPKDLSVLPNYSSSTDSMKDPETNTPYEYGVVSETSYKLCALFSSELTQNDKDSSLTSLYTGDKKFYHPKGYHCFTLNLPSYLVPTPTVMYMTPFATPSATSSASVCNAVFPKNNCNAAVTGNSRGLTSAAKYWIDCPLVDFNCSDKSKQGVLYTGNYYDTYNNWFGTIAIYGAGNTMPGTFVTIDGTPHF